MRPGSACDIALGRELPFSIHDPQGKLLLRRGMVIASEQQLERLVERGFLVAEAPVARVGIVAPPPPAPPPLRVADLPVFDAVREIADRLQMQHNQLLAHVSDGFAAAILRASTQVDDVAARDVDAALASMHLMAADEDGMAARFVHGAVLCRVLATALDLDVRTRLSVIAAALTYDVALTPLAKVLNHQSSPLTDTQRADVRAHPQRACDLLRSAGVEDETWLRAVAEHHERLDGSGYPHALQGDAVSLGARVIGLVDTYSAMVRPRAYRDAVQCRHALRDIFLERGRSVDERLAHVFVKEVGMYPPGSLVRLASREVAVVVRRGSDAAHPEVRVVIQADSARAFAHPARDVRRAGHEIVEGIALQKYPALQPSIHRLWRTD